MYIQLWVWMIHMIYTLRFKGASYMELVIYYRQFMMVNMYNVHMVHLGSGTIVHGHAYFALLRRRVM
jgi:hypothetical protein